ncbi:multiple epidermal growth factor-like domains protein 10 [Mya arenaria]|uniref:multiple epidermal growth factor-like domains protein 10 n=1 Tax=Mya arenaria TaxID=6604 RepID=UPI0022E727CE|nr:multiple epidermal growth factor-like domains protein 10 [Mya arenaria]
MVIFRIVAVLCLVQSCMTVTVQINGTEVDCSKNCVCCQGGTRLCGFKRGFGDNHCFDGCVDTIFGYKCHNSCPGNCYKCGQAQGTPCITCKAKFYDKGSSCSKSCPVGCHGGSCYDDGTCGQCKSNYEGTTCEPCIQGRFGVDCASHCKYQNCRCAYYTGCESCKTGFYGKNTFCQTTCSKGCLDDVCNDDGTCNCTQLFTGLSCTECIGGNYGEDCNMTCSDGCTGGNCMRNGTCYQCNPGSYGEQCNDVCSAGCSNSVCMRNGTCNQCKPGYHGEQCNDMCSVGCGNGVCMRNGECTCKVNFNGTKCDMCKDGMFGNYCQQQCSIGCSLSSCNRSDGSCDCFPNFTGVKCDQCVDGFYGQSCSFNCSRTCIGGICSMSNGSCTNGCNNGYSDNNCSIPCNSTCLSCEQNNENNCILCNNGNSGSTCKCLSHCVCTYGSDKCNSCSNGFKNPANKCKCHNDYCSSDKSNISNTCDRCMNESFYVNNDTCCECPETCKNGLCSTGPLCKEGCIDGFYSESCSKKCTDINAKCLKCNQTTGRCLKCEKGFYPENNESKCISCQFNCKDKECSSESGKCSNGCGGHFWGDMCNLPCHSNCNTCQQESGICDSCKDSTVHGLYCNESCSKSCLENKCERNTSYCSIGCTGHFYGDLCETKCPGNCRLSGTESSCDDDGFCKFNCVDGYEGDDCTIIQVKKEAEAAGPLVGAIAGGISGGVLITIGVVVAFFFLRRRSIRLSAFNENMINEYTTLEHIINDGSAKEYEECNAVHESSFSEDQTYYNEPESSANNTKISISRLVKYVDKKTHDDLSEEFKIFPRGLVKSYVESQKRENTSKNRYKGIYPYDDSRVKVMVSGGSDYINASFIDGYKRPKQYIATLAPMSQQLGDFSLFWKMIWQQRVEKIVMVTNLIEQGSHKCEQYWPDPGTTKAYGEIQVESRSEDEYAEFTRRTFTVTTGTEERTLHHLHFTCWPDKAIPDDVTAIIEFRQRVLSTPSTLNGPTVVHCSSGVGRTGTYIALDVLTEEGETEKAIDISGCVHKMRQNRPNMVQTLEQYMFLHTAVLYSLTFDCKQVRGENFNQYMKNNTTQQLNNTFMQLQHMVDKRSKDETEAVELYKQLLSKNRANADIPGKGNRHSLYQNLKLGASVNIDAVYIDSFGIKKRYLVAKTPLPETVLEFLTLVVQEKCSCIVSFPDDMDKQKNVGTYYPAENKGVLKKGLFEVSCTTEDKKTFYAERLLQIQHKGAGTTADITIQHLQFTDWDVMKNIPRSTTNFLSFLNVIEHVTNKQDDGPILVHCFDGAGKSGLFCVVSLLLHKMSVEHEVSVLNAIRKVKTTRRLAIPNQEQFVFCHGCVSEYISSFGVYTNINEETGIP